MTKRFGIRKEQRLRSPLQFARVYDGGQRAGDGHLLVFAAPNELEITRFGLSVSRKHGKAVKRARSKRLLREAFRLSQHELPRGLDLILIPRQGSGAGVDDYRRSLVRNTERLARRLAPREASSSTLRAVCRVGAAMRPSVIPCLAR